MKRLGAAKYILIMELSYDNKMKVMHLSQKAGIKRMVGKFGHEKSASVYNPTCTSQKLKKT